VQVVKKHLSKFGHAIDKYHDLKNYKKIMNDINQAPVLFIVQ